MSTREPWRPLAIAAVGLVVAAGCGNRLSTEKILAENTVTVKGSAAGATNGGGPDTATADAAAGTAAGASTTVPGSATGNATAAGPGGAANPSSSKVTTAGGTTNTTAGGDAARAAGASATGQTAGAKAPIVIGYIGWLSGLGGDTIAPTRDAWQAWAKMINAKGGINGHPVQLLIGDHGGDEARALSIARDFVENKGAIALSFNANGTGLGDYAKSKNVPAIGGVMTGGNWNSNPLLFPPIGAELNSSWGGVALMKRAGVTKVASMYCAESPDCQQGSSRFASAVKDGGLQLVSQQQYSETQPDFTAECIQMRSSGAQAVWPTGSTAAMIRMAASCSRQGFKPIWVAPTMDDSIAGNPDFDNAIAVNSSFPWFLRSGNPGVEEYAAAIGKYAPSRLTTGNTFQTEAWVSAKLFEKAAANVSDKPTSQDILNALWAMRGETLGGLIPPRTFTRGQPTPETYCVYEGRVKGGKWTAPDGMTPLCR
jgi:branched-chain amino acid transport system substrate-binding protein